MLAHARAFGRDPELGARRARAGYGRRRSTTPRSTSFVAARRFQVTIWFAVMAGPQPEFAERAESLIGFYRERA